MTRCHTHSCAFSIEVWQGMGYAPAVVLYRSGGNWTSGRWLKPRLQTALPYGPSLARVYKPCALQVKKAELVEGLGNTHGIRPRRKEDVADWLVRVLYRLEYCEHPLRSYCGVVALLEKFERLAMGWGYNEIPPANRTKPWRHVSRWAARTAISTPELMKCCFGWDWHVRSRSR